MEIPARIRPQRFRRGWSSFFRERGRGRRTGPRRRGTGGFGRLGRLDMARMVAGGACGWPAGGGAMIDGQCPTCDRRAVLTPLHGEKGGPLRCFVCVGAWNAEQGRKRRTGRVAARALMAFRAAGGTMAEVDKLVASSSLAEIGLGDHADLLDRSEVEMTSELLADVLQLVHPDKHPAERAELAGSVTQRLLALKPFVFPARPPKVEAEVEPEAEAEPGVEWALPEPRYPCADCREAPPMDYCDACKAEYDRREQADFEARTKKQRAAYGLARERTLRRRPKRMCECGRPIKSRRADARYCSPACRQRAHRKAVTDRSNAHGGTSSKCYDRAILAHLERHPAVFLNDLLPEGRSRAEYQALSIAAIKLEEGGKIDTTSYTYKFNKPEHQVLLRKDANLDIGPDDIHRLTDDERRTFAKMASGELERVR